MKLLKLILVTENASLQMGGEAAQTLTYFRKLSDRNIDVWVVCHIRVKDELRRELSLEEFEKVFFIEDTFFQRFLWNIGKNFPTRIQELVVGQLIHLLFQHKAKNVVRNLICKNKIQLVFQPTPNSPKSPSYMYNLGVPGIMGPMKGGVRFPVFFRYMDSFLIRMSLSFAAFFASFLNRFIPGKLLADVLLVGDEITKGLLPSGCRGQVFTFFECGIDLKAWQQKKRQVFEVKKPVRFVFTGRLVDWKGVQFLLEAFQIVQRDIDVVLEIVGDGPLIHRLKKQAESAGISHCIKFHGWLYHEELIKILLDADIFVMPSLRESCGISILEAMAVGLPVIAVDWAGPARILDSSCGLLVKPYNHHFLVLGFVRAMRQLANSPDLRKKIGKAGRMHLMSEQFDWDLKIDRLVDIFQKIVVETRY